MTTETGTAVALTTYRFTFTLGGVPEVPAEVTDAEFDDRMAATMDDVCGRVLATGCDDSTLASRGQAYLLHFDREAEPLGDAIGSAVKAVEKAGFKVARVKVEGARA